MMSPLPLFNIISSLIKSQWIPLVIAEITENRTRFNDGIRARAEAIEASRREVTEKQEPKVLSEQMNKHVGLPSDRMSILKHIALPLLL